MKKILCMIIAVVFCVAMASCGDAGTDPATEAPTDAATDPATEPATDPATEPATNENSILTDDVETLLERLYAYEGYGPKTRSIIDTNLQSYALDADNQVFYTSISGLEFSEGIASDPIMQPCPFMVCMIRLSDMSQLESVKAELVEKANPNRWSCASLTTDQILVDNIGDVVILIMAEEAGDVQTAFRALEP